MTENKKKVFNIINIVSGFVMFAFTMFLWVLFLLSLIKKIDPNDPLISENPFYNSSLYAVIKAFTLLGLLIVSNYAIVLFIGIILHLTKKAYEVLLSAFILYALFAFIFLIEGINRTDYTSIVIIFLCITICVANIIICFLGNIKNKKDVNVEAI